MVVKMIRKREMDMETGSPSNDAPDVSQHAHSEYDQCLVKIQELESRVKALEVGEMGEAGNPPAGVPAGPGEPGAECSTPMMPKKKSGMAWGAERIDLSDSSIERLAKAMKEEIKGTPERGTSKKTGTADPKNPMQIPQTTQPGTGDAPGSGTTFDEEGKLGDKSEVKAPAPKSDYDKISIKKNKMDEAKSLVERAKVLMKEASEDPTEPKPGETKKEPDKMDMGSPKSSVEAATNVPGATKDDIIGKGGEAEEKKPVGKEEFGKKEDEEEEKEGKKSVTEKLKREIKKEAYNSRQSIVGLSSEKKEGSQFQENMGEVKKNSHTLIKEYLKIAGHGAALGYMS